MITCCSEHAAARRHAHAELADLCVIDHAADGIWLAQGWLINAEGTHELFPTTDAGWNYASNSHAAIHFLLQPSGHSLIIFCISWRSSRRG